MAPGLASTIANEIIDALGGTNDWTAPTACYVKLHTGDPGTAGTANAAGETTRKQVGFGAASAGAASNSAAVTWTSVSTTETYSHVSFWDHLTAGSFLYSDALAASKAVTAGDNAEFATGDIDLSITPVVS